MAFQNAVQLLDPTQAALAQQEDAVAAASSYGIPIIGVRQDVPGTGTGVNGDWVLHQFDSGNRLWVAGQIPHDSAIAGAPFRIGGRARTTADITAVANDDQVDLISDEYGKQIVLLNAHPNLWTDGLTAAITGTSDTAVIAAPGAGLRLNITSVLVTNSHATVGTVVELKSGSTARARGYAGPLGLGFMLIFRTPLKIAVNTAFNAANITTGSNTYVSASGYISSN